MAEGEATSLEKLEAAHDAAAAGADATPPSDSAEAGKETKPTEVEPEAKPKEEAKPPEPEDNRERSQLGRRVKALEDNINALVSELRTERRKPKQEEFDPDTPLTVRELDSYLARKRAEESTERQQYINEYLRTEANLGMEMDDEEYAEVVEERLKHFDIRHSNDPKRDAELNFAKAQASVLKKKLGSKAEKKNPLEGKKPTGPLGGPATNQNTQTARKVVKLDEHASGFAKAMGLSEEKIQKIMEE